MENMEAKESVFQDTFCKLDGDSLTIGNSAVERKFTLKDGRLRTVSLCDGNGSIFGNETSEECDFQFFGMRPPADQMAWEITDVSTETVPGSHFDSAHLLIRIFQNERRSNTRFVREYRIYPNLPVISMQCRVTNAVYPNSFWNPRSALRSRFAKTAPDAKGYDAVMDILTLPEKLSRTESVEFHGWTDECDAPVERHSAPANEYTGNLLFCTGDDASGIFCLQEAPPSEASRELADYDFRRKKNTVFSCGWGITPGEIVLEKEYISYRHVIGLFHSDKERNTVLKEYLKRRFESAPQRFGTMVNPWGCGRYMKLLNEEFMLDEIRSAAECGAAYYQIDDSWQAGGNLGNICYFNEDFNTSEYWQIRPTLFNGSFDPIVETAGECGIETGLWLAPSSHKNYADCEEFISVMLELHRRYGFKLIKIDGTLTRTYDAEERLRHLLESSVTASGGEIFFNLDTTWGQRPGYFLMQEYGNIFLENRYVYHDHGLGYHPERTLRNFWDLAHFVRAQKLQIEIPYPGDINYEFYRNKKESAPDTYSWDYWMAIALFANPLFWFAPSLLSADEKKQCADFNALRNSLLDRISGGIITPAGSRPDGRSITGFISENPEMGDTLILFREAECPQERFPLPGGTSWKKITGDGQVKNGEAVFEKNASFLIMKSI